MFPRPRGLWTNGRESLGNTTKNDDPFFGKVLGVGLRSHFASRGAGVSSEDSFFRRTFSLAFIMCSAVMRKAFSRM